MGILIKQMEECNYPRMKITDMLDDVDTLAGPSMKYGRRFCQKQDVH